MIKVVLIVVSVCALGIPASLAHAAPGPCDLLDLSGRWAFVQVMVSRIDVPLAGEVELTTRVVLLVDVQQDADIVALQDLYCFTDTFSAPAVMRSEITEAFMRSLRPGPRTAQLVCEAGILRFIQDEYWEVRGADLEAPITDPLPTDPSDPRVVDQDADGLPGLTVPIEILGLIRGETHIVQRVRYTLHGEVLDHDSIRGTIDWESEQVVVSASTPLLSISLAEWRHPEISRHWFAMERVEEDWGCSDLRAWVEALRDPSASLQNGL